MSMTGHDPQRSTAANYRAFATVEAAGRSPAYERLGLDVAADGEVLEFLSRLPWEKRQPTLLFAAARYLLDVTPDIAALRRLVHDRPQDLSHVMSVRRTQTNEAGRCATLLPALALLPGPLALIEVGASAGLTLLPDHHSYDYDGRLLNGTDPEAPVLRCSLRAPAAPVPAQMPEVCWRAGIDLNPLDVTDPDDVTWLRCLVWPGQEHRERRLLAAVETARRDPPSIRRGDLLELPALVAQAPVGATVVVFHSAVLAYVGPDKRSTFAELVRDLGVRWLSNEGAGVLPGIELPAHDGVPFVLVADSATPLAFTDPHGAWLQWIAPAVQPVDGRSD